MNEMMHDMRSEPPANPVDKPHLECYRRRKFTVCQPIGVSHEGDDA